MHTRRSAFTLIELMVVVVIMALLTAVAVVNYNTAQRSARDNARKTAVGGIATAIETYYRDNHSFPGIALGAAGPCRSADADTSVFYSYAPNQACADPGNMWIPGLSPYMSTVPVDKRFLDTSGKTYDQLIATGAAADLGEQWTTATRTYTYRKISTTTGFGYLVYSKLEGNDTGSGIVTGPLTGDVPSILNNDPKSSIYVIQR